MTRPFRSAGNKLSGSLRFFADTRIFYRVNDRLIDFEKRPTSFDGVSYDVFVAGTGPAIVVLPEVPGVTPDVADCGRRLAAAGYTAWIPSLFGTPGKPLTERYAATTLAKLCVRKEFLAFARGQRAPITDWMRSLVAHAHEQSGGPGVGVIGMCFTGGFALALAVDPAVLVPVMSQPSLPIGPFRQSRRDLHISPDDLATVKQRTIDDNLCVIGLRFTKDSMVPVDRFTRLRHEFGEAFIGVEIDSSKGNSHGYGRRSHSVLTTEFSPDANDPTNEAFELVLTHFGQKLLEPGT